jgi:hypothetical protein
MKAAEKVGASYKMLCKHENLASTGGMLAGLFQQPSMGLRLTGAASGRNQSS